MGDIREWPACRRCVAAGIAAFAMVALDGARADAQIGPPPGPGKVTVSPDIGQPVSGGGIDVLPLQNAMVYMWNNFIALNWPADESAGRGVPDRTKTFGATAADGSLLPTVWQTMRSKVEVYPGDGSATVPPHGVRLNAGVPVNKATNYGYSDPPKYRYAPGSVGGDGSIAACPGQVAPSVPAYINVDETTQIGNNQLFAGAMDAIDPTGRNSAPRLVRYVVKMNPVFWSFVIPPQYWYYAKGASPLDTAQQNYQAAYAKRLADIAGTGALNPTGSYVTFADGSRPDDVSIEIKAAFRPLTADEMSSRRFFTAPVRYYESSGSAPCYREDVWGLVSMHVIAFTAGAPWGIWSTFEHSDLLLTADGKPVEDDAGAATGNVPAGTAPSEPDLASDPTQLEPIVAITPEGAGYCAAPGKRLYYRENPQYGYTQGGRFVQSLPAGGDICVNTRYRAIPSQVIALNKQAHDAIRNSLIAAGQLPPIDSPWLHYRLTHVQSQPVDVSQLKSGNVGGDASHYGSAVTTSPESYYLADAGIETDYSLGNFTGNLVQGAPSDVQQADGGLVPYINTVLLRYQSNSFGSLVGAMKMGGCAGCHGFASSIGNNFSFALGSNPPAPDAVDPFGPNVKGQHLYTNFIGDLQTQLKKTSP